MGRSNIQNDNIFSTIFNIGLTSLLLICPSCLCDSSIIFRPRETVLVTFYFFSLLDVFKNYSRMSAQCVRVLNYSKLTSTKFCVTQILQMCVEQKLEMMEIKTENGIYYLNDRIYIRFHDVYSAFFACCGDNVQ